MEDSLIILSVNRFTSLSEGTLAIKLEVEHQNTRRGLEYLHYLSGNDFDELKSFLLSTNEVCTRENFLPVVEDLLELQYAISLLKEHVLDFTVRDIFELFQSNKRLLRPQFYLKQLITRLRSVNDRVEARAYTVLLRRLQEYSPDAAYLDVTMMNACWFDRFRRYLQDTDRGEKETSDCMHLLWQVYTDICKVNGAKIIDPLAGSTRYDLLERNFTCFFTGQDISKLLETSFEDENLEMARNFLIVKFWNTKISFIDLLDLKMEDVHSDGIWYRRQRDNRLCFLKQPTTVIHTIRKKMNRGGNLLFPSPFEKIKDEGRRLDLKVKFYLQQIRTFTEQFRINANGLNYNE